MRRTVAIGLMGLSIAVLPAPARGGTARGVALGAGAAVASMIGCVAIRELPADKDAEEDGFARPGWLAGVAGSYAHLGDAFDDSSSVDGLGVNGRVGYRCHPRVAAEFQVEWFEANDIRGNRLNGDVEILTATANAKGYLLTGRYQPFVLLGGGAVSARTTGRSLGLAVDETETDFAFRFGGGIDLYATKNLVATLEAGYVLPFGDVSTVDYIWFGWGFQYRF